MLVDTLNQKHPSYDADCWEEYDALYKGGRAFRRCIDRFLCQNPKEPLEIYNARKKEAFYRGYVGPIVDYFAAKLFTASLTPRARHAAGADGAKSDTPPDVPPFYATWKEDVTGSGTDLVDFARERFLAALVKGRTWWLVHMPDDGGAAPQNRLEYEERGLGGATLETVANEDVYDWEVDENGRLVFAIVHTYEVKRQSPAATRGRVREVWRVYDTEACETFSVEYDPKDPAPESAVSEGRKAHGFRRVPLVRMGFVGARGVRVKIGPKTVNVSPDQLEGLWLVNRLADAQLEHFRLSNGLSWNIKRTCYAMPVFKVTDEQRPPIMGPGYFIMIGAGEDMDWKGPPTGHLEIMTKEISSQKDEIYRISNQMAQGVDNNAAAVGRSGQSKAVDHAATEVCLRVYGAVVKAPIEETYELITEARGEDNRIAWSIEGLESFNVADVATTIAAILQSQMLSIPSKTFRRESYKRAADVILPNITQDTKDQIYNEIDDGVDAEGELHAMLGEAAGLDANGPTGAALAGLGGVKQLGGLGSIGHTLNPPPPPPPPAPAPPQFVPGAAPRPLGPTRITKTKPAAAG